MRRNNYNFFSFFVIICLFFSFTTIAYAGTTYLGIESSSGAKYKVRTTQESNNETGWTALKNGSTIKLEQGDKIKFTWRNNNGYMSASSSYVIKVNDKVVSDSQGTGSYTLSQLGTYNVVAGWTSNPSAVNFKISVANNEHTHSFGDWKVTTNATCTTSGVKTRTCSCGEKETEKIAALGHNYKATSISATCTKAGATTNKCTRCGDTKITTVQALGHDYKITSTSATCTVAGYTTKKCSRCGDTQTTTNQALGHNYKATSTSATCTKAGVTTNKCSRCGDTQVSTVPALGHNYKATSISATCTKAGVTTNKCSRCGDLKTTTTPALGHDYTKYSKKDNTSHYKVCKNCGNKVAEKHNIVNDVCTKCGFTSHNHVYANAVVTVAATCTSKGSRTLTCSCGMTKTESIKALGHNYQMTSVSATEHQKICTRCQKTYGSKFKHSLENGACKYCNYVVCSHANAQYSQYNSIKHAAICPNCKESIYESHKFVNNVCSVCGYEYVGYDWSNVKVNNFKKDEIQFTAEEIEEYSAELKKIVEEAGEGTRAATVSCMIYLASLNKQVGYGSGSGSHSYNKVGFNEFWNKSKKGITYGLDCCGYINWAMYNSKIDSGVSTNVSNITYIKNMELSEIQPGMFVYNKGSNVYFSDSKVNHIGMVVGVQENYIYIAESCGYNGYGIRITRIDYNNLSSSRLCVVRASNRFCSDEVGNMPNIDWSKAYIEY